MSADDEYASTIARLEASECRDVATFAPVPTEDLDSATLEPPQFVIDSILPRSHVTLMGAHGGAGKSVLALAWAAHVAAGVGWGPMTVQQGKALFVSLEDGADLLRFRLKRIVEVCRIDPHLSADLAILDASKSDGTLAIERSEGGTTRLAMTAAWAELQNLAEGFDLIVIDNASDAFGGNENVRRQVRYFLRNLSQLAAENGAAVLLLAHIDKAAARHGAHENHFSGSTAWHNTARSRLALLKEEDALYLVHEKSNLGPRNEPIALAWDGPVLMPMARDRVAEQNIADKQADEDASNVLAVMRIAIDAGDDVTTATAGPSTTFHVLAAYPELPAELQSKSGRRRFWAAVKRLQREKQIVKAEYPNHARKTKERFELAQTAPVDAEKSAPVIYPHTPIPELAHTGEPCASLDSCSSSGTGATGAKCPKCDGEGCRNCHQTGVMP